MSFGETGLTVSTQEGLAVPKLEEGLEVGGFTILGQVGVSKHCRVFEATSPILKEAAVALKLLPQPQTPDDRQLLAGEIQAHRKLQQTTLPVVAFETGIITVDNIDYPYAALPLMERTLEDEVLQKGWLEPEQAALTGQRILANLIEMHEAGLAEIDLNPGNVLIDSDGDKHVGDFGSVTPIGSRLKAVPANVATQAIATPPGFTPPELLRGDPVHKQTDMFGLAALMHWLTSGEVHEGPIPPTALPESPVDYATIIMEMQANQPVDRPTDSAAYDRLGQIAA
jgi:serine/threonine protein kinase